MGGPLSRLFLKVSTPIAATERIIAQIQTCPSGAPSYRWNNREGE